MATIYDVAKCAKVSPKTVSRVMNGEGPVGESTRQKVLSAMQQLGYVPSKAARSMRQNKSGLIGLITGAITRAPQLLNPIGLPDIFIVQGIQEVIAEKGLTLMIADTGGDSSKVEPLIHTFQQHRVEGLLYVADYHREVHLEANLTALPLVLVNCYDQTGLPSVLPDDYEGQRKLTERIIAHGHRRIAYLSLDDILDATQLRTQGYRDALTAAGIAYDPALVVVGLKQNADDSHQAFALAVEYLMNLEDRPSVICCGNDEIALRLYGHLRTRGFRLPEEISVAGYDNHRAIAETLFPPLSTVELPYYAMGRKGAELLFDCMQNNHDIALTTQNPIRVQGPIVWRSSIIPRDKAR